MKRKEGQSLKKHIIEKIDKHLSENGMELSKTNIASMCQEYTPEKVIDSLYTAIKERREGSKQEEVEETLPEEPKKLFQLEEGNIILI